MIYQSLLQRKKLKYFRNPEGHFIMGTQEEPFTEQKQVAGEEAPNIDLEVPLDSSEIGYYAQLFKNP